MGSGLAESLRILGVFKRDSPAVTNLAGDLEVILSGRFGKGNVSLLKDGTLYAHTEGVIIAPMDISFVEKELLVLNGGMPPNARRYIRGYEEGIDSTGQSESGVDG